MTTVICMCFSYKNKQIMKVSVIVNIIVWLNNFTHPHNVFGIGYVINETTVRGLMDLKDIVEQL